MAAIVEHAGAGVVADTPTGAAGEQLAGFRRLFYGCLRRRADALFELTDALLCAPGSVISLPELSLVPVHRRGHGALYDAMAAGQLEVDSLRRSLAGLVLPRGTGGQIRLAADVSPWPRPDAECSPQRCHCHRPCRCDGVRQTIPGWPYSMIAGLESGRSSWTALLDAVRLRPGDDATEVTAAQLRELVARLVAAGQWVTGDPPILVVFDAGHDVVRLAWLLADLPVQLVGRVRSDRVFAARPTRYAGTGRPGRHGRLLKCDDPATWPAPDAVAADVHTRYGTVAVQAWSCLHPRLTRRGGWQHHSGPLPIVEGTLIYILPALQADPWLDPPRVRTPEQADRWTWLILVAYTQLRLSRGLTADLRRPWEAPLDPHRLTPARVRRGFLRIRRTAGLPAVAPKPTRPGPGRRKGKPNSHQALRYNAGKHSKVDTTKLAKTSKKR